MKCQLIELATIVATLASMASAFASTYQKVALVTGSNKGIGKEIARKIGKEEGFLCILGSRNEELGQIACEELKSEGCNVSLVQVDLDDHSTIEQASKIIEEQYGRCDVLINNAAVCFNSPTLYGKVPHTSFAEQASITIRTNFFGTLELTRALLPLMRKSASPRIINIASSAGRLSILPSKDRQDAFSSETLRLEELENFMHDFVADAEGGVHSQRGWPNTGYGVSKVGIISMTKILAREEGQSFMVNSVDPGYCKTDQNDNQGFVPAQRGATTPFLLATLPDDQYFSGMHWYEEQAVKW
ncbi:unnamed protein product [Heterosigma akashiwo]